MPCVISLNIVPKGILGKKSYIRRNLTYRSDIFLSKRHATIMLELQNGLHREHISSKYSFTMKMYQLLMKKICIWMFSVVSVC